MRKLHFFKSFIGADQYIAKRLDIHYFFPFQIENGRYAVQDFKGNIYGLTVYCFEKGEQKKIGLFPIITSAGHRLDF